jgi:hypothetical protein
MSETKKSVENFESLTLSQIQDSAAVLQVLDGISSGISSTSANSGATTWDKFLLFFRKIWIKFTDFVDEKFPKERDKIIFWIVFGSLSFFFIMHALSWVLYEMTFGLLFWIVKTIFSIIVWIIKFIFGAIFSIFRSSKKN